MNKQEHFNKVASGLYVTETPAARYGMILVHLMVHEGATPDEAEIAAKFAMGVR